MSESFAAAGMLIGFFGVGILGTYYTMKDKTIISSGPGATFDLYWKYFVFFAVIGGIGGGIVGSLFGSLIKFLLDHWEYVIGAIVIGIMAMDENKKKENEVAQVDENAQPTDTATTDTTDTNTK